MEAFSFIVSNPDISLILIDRRLPSISGDELCMKLREHPYTKDIPIIIVSGLKDIDEIAELMDKVGIKTYLTKPISPDVLRNHVGVYLKNAQFKKSHKKKFINQNIFNYIALNQFNFMFLQQLC
eukprot:TRINITY_DN9870_c0_g1_i1.p2 TRINITY_DN9870_c0_g1~~TRINITY_DN9870_c0_g1_i1.p2  ORF type:complete len:124 (+),score=7.85 TRINITY_DN9870_c0_g1_i1:301-672(+)